MAIKSLTLPKRRGAHFFRFVAWFLVRRKRELLATFDKLR